MAVGREAVSVAQPGDPLRPSCQTNLSIALRETYEATRDLASLRAAVRISREAVEADGPDRAGRANYFNNLSANCQELFKRTGEIWAIVEAVHAAEQSVALSPEGSRLWADRLTELGNALHILADAPRYGATGSAAVAGSVAAPDTRVCAAEYRGGDDVLRRALAVQRMAATASSHTGALGNLSVVARTLFERTGDRTALNEAIRAARAAVGAAEPASSMRDQAVLGLIRALAHHPDDPAVIEEISGYCRELKAVRATPRTQVAAHRFLGNAAMASGALDLAWSAYESAVARLPEIAPRSLLRPDREHGLSELAGLPGEAASVALRLGRPNDALVVLEHSRGVLLRESMGGRGDLDELNGIDPAASEEFVRLRDLLDVSDRSSTDLYGFSGPMMPGIGDRTSRHRRLADEWEQLLVHIRQLPGMDGFLRPPTAELLRRVPAEGPIVVVNAGPIGCDAILLAVDGTIHHIPLDCSYEELGECAESFRNSSSPSPAADERQHRAGRETRILADLAWLWDRIAEPVLAAAGLLSSLPRTPDAAPRLWWCPVGLAAFLPFHAAGHHGANSTSTVMDYVVSSYTTTLTALLVARRARRIAERHRAVAGRDLLIVEMSSTPGASALPGVRAESRRLAEIAPSSTILADSEATRDAVMAALPRHRIAHFACHAVTDPRAPGLNRLLLADHVNSPLTAIELSTSNMPDVELAYLSACETASPSARLADEAVHIAAAFQLAGYRHIVATLWPISDKAAGRIADDFYTAIAPALSTRETARALHRATLGLRADAPDRPSRWAAHIHFGT